MQSGLMALRVMREGDVLVVAATGVITVGSAKTLRANISGHLVMQDARAVLCDLRGAVHLLTAGGWQQLVEHAVATWSGVPPVPVAVLVAPVNLEAMRQHCRQLAQHGFLRLAFCERQAAFSWAARRMEHWDWAPG